MTFHSLGFEVELSQYFDYALMNYPLLRKKQLQCTAKLFQLHFCVEVPNKNTLFFFLKLSRKYLHYDVIITNYQMVFFNTWISDFRVYVSRDLRKWTLFEDIIFTL